MLNAIYRRHPRYFASDLAAAWFVATIVSGLPSTLYAVATGGDPMAATRAAAAMLVNSASSAPILLFAAALVHSSISLFWAIVLILLLPGRHVIAFAMGAAAAIAVLDLRVIGRLFPEIHALEFWPQFADHLLWGASLGWTLRLCSSKRAPASRTFT